jgi:oxygen-independent coproporphyrinogen-3 oxidase
MAGLYLHIPFCRQACHYCDFHFSTSLAKIGPMVQAMKSEIERRAPEWKGERFETLYFGGGTPSLIAPDLLVELIDTAKSSLQFESELEVTLECNPEDIDEASLKAWRSMGINRLSIGIQAFDDRALTLMNRVHDAACAMHALELATTFIESISVDLIYGIPERSDTQLMNDVSRLLDFGITHVSAYALTVEPQTALERFIAKGIIDPIDEEQAAHQFNLIMDRLEDAGFLHYELSNYALPGHESRNNSAYWMRKPYLGIGPGAHSFKEHERRWNVSNNPTYIHALKDGTSFFETETLSKRDHYNEYVMTALRTHWGVSLDYLTTAFGRAFKDYFTMISTPFILDNLLFEDEGVIRATRKGKFLVDGIASELFMLELQSPKDEN